MLYYVRFSLFRFVYKNLKKTIYSEFNKNFKNLHFTPES